jgi:hypothetical protein
MTLSDRRKVREGLVQFVLRGSIAHPHQGVRHPGHRTDHDQRFALHPTTNDLGHAPDSSSVLDRRTAKFHYDHFGTME